MRKTLLLLLAFLPTPVLADPIPVFDSPETLLRAVYDQIEASEDWENFDADAGFDEREAFSARLGALLDAADETVNPTGEDIGALDFSPFINGQDSGGMAFEIGDAKIKGSRAVAAVDIYYGDDLYNTITFEMVDDGADGWKVDDVILPMVDDEGTWRLSDYLADPLGQ